MNSQTIISDSQQCHTTDALSTRQCDKQTLATQHGTAKHIKIYRKYWEKHTYLSAIMWYGGCGDNTRVVVIDGKQQTW